MCEEKATYYVSKENVQNTEAVRVSPQPFFNGTYVEPQERGSEFEKSHNGENYPDPTCYKTVKKLEYEQHKEWERHHKLIGCILRICELSGFSLENRIVLKDKKTGKVWE